MEPDSRDVSIMRVLGPQFDSHKLSICAAAWWAQIWENAKRLRAIVQLFEKVLVHVGKDENINVTKHIGHTRSPRSIKFYIVRKSGSKRNRDLETLGNSFETRKSK